MKNKKILFILIPIILTVLILIAGVVYLKLNSTPEKIFKNSISAAFKIFESSEEQYSTMKGTINLTANVESDNEEMEAINMMLEGASIGLNMEADTTNMIVNENLNITYNNESLLNAMILLQDEKGYVYLPDWLNKYLQIPENELEYSELVAYSEKIATLDQNKLMEAIKEELIASVSNQELLQGSDTLILDGQKTKVIASTLRLKDEQLSTFVSDFLNNLNKNEKFQAALGAYKEDIQETINEMLQYMGVAEDKEFIFTIYTKGFSNEVVGVTAKVIDTSYEETIGLNILKHNNGKYEFVAYNEYDGTREEILKLVIEDKKESENKGTATITVSVDGEKFIIVNNYEIQGNQTIFNASTEIEGVKAIVSGNVVESGKNYKGNLILTVEQEEIGKINLNCAYDFTLDVEVQKVDIQNAVLIDELSEEDQTTIMTNLQKSALYQLIEQSGLIDNKIGDKPEVTYGGHTVTYNVPAGFEASSYSTEVMKMYMDNDYNSVSVYINNDIVDTYMKDLEEEYVLTSSLYKNQQISETKTYTVNDMEYKFRTITYEDEYGTYANLYFAYKLDDEYCYVVEVETEGGNMSMETVKYFLDVIVE
ncbi:MAG: hypothetical protein J6A29_03595 [Clostridia bacterium]|nr:hypothetical protein [Clostridia bacterium]